MKDSISFFYTKSGAGQALPDRPTFGGAFFAASKQFVCEQAKPPLPVEAPSH